MCFVIYQQILNQMADFYENESNPVAEDHCICIFVCCHFQHVRMNISYVRQIMAFGVHIPSVVNRKREPNTAVIK